MRGAVAIKLGNRESLRLTRRHKSTGIPGSADRALWLLVVTHLDHKSLHLQDAHDYGGSGVIFIGQHAVAKLSMRQAGSWYALSSLEVHRKHNHIMSHLD